MDEINPRPSRVWGVDLTVNNFTYDLRPVSFRERNTYPWVNTTNGPPEAFFIYDTNKLAIMPSSDREYDLTIWYLPVFEDLKNDEDIFDPIISGGEEWVIWDSVEKVCTRDNYPKMVRAAQQNKELLMREIVHRAVAQRAGPTRRLDTKTRDKYKRYGRWWWGTTGGAY